MLWMFLSCSFQLPSYDICESDTDCQQVFGAGYTCGEEGFCNVFTPQERCPLTFPTDLYENWDSYNQSYILGTLFNHTNDEANLVASTLAVEEARDLPIDGKKDIVLIHCDYAAQDENGDGLSRNDAVQMLSNHLSNDIGVQAVIGPAGSESSSVAFNATDDLLFVSPSATSMTLSTIDGELKSDAEPGRFWRTVASDALQARVLASIVISGEFSNIGLHYENSVYGSDFISLMEDEFAINNLSSTRYPYNIGDTNTAKNQAIAIGESNHSAIVIISSDISDLKKFITYIADKPQFVGKTLFFADGAADSALLEVAVDLQGTDITVYGTRPPLLDGALFNSFEALFRLKAIEMGWPNLEAQDDVYSAYTYDATWMALYGFAWSYFQEESSTYQGIARGLRKLSNTESDIVNMDGSGWATILSKFSQGEEINIRGTSGELDYDLSTEELNSDVEIWSLGTNYDCFFHERTCDSNLDCHIPENAPTCE